MHFEDALYHEMTGHNFTGEKRCIKKNIYLNNMKNEALFWMNILWKRNHVPRKNWCNFCFKQRKWCKNQNLKGTETKSYLETWMKIWNLLDEFSFKTLWGFCKDISPKNFPWSSLIRILLSCDEPTPVTQSKCAPQKW